MSTALRVHSTTDPQIHGITDPLHHRTTPKHSHYLEKPVYSAGLRYGEGEWATGLARIRTSGSDCQNVSSEM